MKSVTYYTPDGEAYALLDNEYLFLTDWMGLGMPPVQPIGEPTPYVDGVVHRGLYTPPRDFALTVHIVADSLADLTDRAAALRRGLNPYRDRETPGYLRFILDNDAVRHLDCFPLSFPNDSASRGGITNKIPIMFRAQETWFYDPEAITISAELSVDSGVDFPITFPITFAATNIDDLQNINNIGDLDTWPVIVITAPGQNPVITNVTTGKLIDLNGLTLEASDTLTIDMEAATALFWDNSGGTTTNAAITSASSYWPLVRGNNQIHIVMTNGFGASVTVTMYPRYLGV